MNDESGAVGGATSELQRSADMGHTEMASAPASIGTAPQEKRRKTSGS